VRHVTVFLAFGPARTRRVRAALRPLPPIGSARPWTRRALTGSWRLQRSPGQSQQDGIVAR